MASPAEIVRACLVEKGLVVWAPTPGLTVCYVSSMSDEDDRAVCVYDTAGLLFGRRMLDGRTLNHPGIKILIRALDYSGYTLANTIAVGLDSISSGAIEVDGASYSVQSVYRTSPVISLGEEVGKKRQLWSINARVAFRDCQSSF